jgi:hypothetical protein
VQLASLQADHDALARRAADARADMAGLLTAARADAAEATRALAARQTECNELAGKVQVRGGHIARAWVTWFSVALCEGATCILGLVQWKRSEVGSLRGALAGRPEEGSAKCCIPVANVPCASCAAMRGGVGHPCHTFCSALHHPLVFPSLSEC